MCRSVAASTAKLQLVAERSLEMLLALVVPTSVGLFFLADQALVMLYGDQQFAVASVAVRIMVWSLVLRVFTHVLGGALIATSRERLNLRITVVDVVANASLGVILIPQLGLVGAALTSLLVRLVDFVQHCIPIFRIFPEMQWLGTSWRTIVASGVMACYLAQWADENIWRTIGGAALLYLALWMALTVWSAGGAHRLKAKYLSSGAHCRRMPELNE
jgi:O-antigen/teichoic acid export membrane protein